MALLCCSVPEPVGGTRPWFVIRPKPAVTVVLGQHVLISCAIAGDPFPEFGWMKDDASLSSGGELRLVQKRNVISLLIRKVALHHAGEYHIRLRYIAGGLIGAATVCQTGPCKLSHGAYFVT